MSPFENRFNKFLATGEYVAAEDARPKGWKPDPEKFLKNLLSQHDKRFHPNGFNPETDTCIFREQLDKTNNIDDLSAAEKRESEEKNATFKVGDKVQDPESGGFGKVTDVSGTRIRVSWDNGNSTWESEDKMTLSGESASPLGDPERGRQAIIDGPGAGYLATLEREVAAGKTEGLEGEKKRCRHYIENGKDDAEKQLHRDALAFLEELGKKAKADVSPAFKYGEGDFVEELRTGKTWRVGEKSKDTVELWQWPGSGMTRVRINDFDKDFKSADKSVKADYEKAQAEGVKTFLKESIKDDYEKDEIGKKTGQTIDEFVKQFIDDAKADGFTVSEKSVDLLRMRMEGLKKTPASKAYEPRFDMNKQGLYGYGKTDSDAKEAAKLAAAFNQKAEWGFPDDEVQAYFDAFKDMDAGKFPYGLPEFEGKVNEKNFNEGDFSGESKDFQKLLRVLGSRPDLIRPYIVERLEDAGFSSEVKELRSGAYKKRTKPYNSQEEYEERQRRQMAQDAAAVKYLKEC